MVINGRAPFQLTKAILVEGQDALRFFEAYLKHLGNHEQIEVRNFGGVNELSNYTKLIPMLEGLTISSPWQSFAMRKRMLHRRLLRCAVR